MATPTRKCKHCGQRFDDKRRGRPKLYCKPSHRVRGAVHTNGIESSWANFKRTVYGTHHFVMPWQLDRYLDDATFRFNQRNIGDGDSFALALVQADGRRLTYKELISNEEVQ